MTTLSGYQRNLSRYGRVYYEYLCFLREFDKWPLKRKMEYQRQELIRLLSYAVDRSPFYNELYRGIDISSIRTVDDLRMLPIVDKEMLRANIDKVVTVPRREAVQNQTGGTTGKSLTVYATREDMMKRMAMLDRFKERVGFVHRKMRRATFMGKHIIPPDYRGKVFWRYNAASKQMLYSSFHLSEKNMEYYVDSLNRFKPAAIDGFFSSICDLASYIERSGKELTFVPIAIFPTSETLNDSGRQLIERVFKCKVYDQYASSEGAPFVTECRNQVKHVELASGVFERLSGDSDEILVTSFYTYGTPLIRYRIGDSMEFDMGSRKCDCGIESPVVKAVYGRMLDFLYTVDGARINAVNVANLFKKISNAIIRAQVIQTRLDEFRVKLEVDRTRYVRAFDDLLKDEFAHTFGRLTRVIIEHVSEIPRNPSGKHQLIVNDLLSDCGPEREH